MGFKIQQYIALLGRAINPTVWRRTWTRLEGHSPTMVTTQVAEWTNRQIAIASHVSQYRHWWWANPFGMGLIFFLSYKAWYMIYMVRKQKKTSQVVASAYGQGGQWLDPVPK
ncbi:hypothetical protein IE077_003812 [Cardiosporidium cionae]|uniref:Uncharacterized protein n=1 Tax=Cardiosporidium cionae TaxID=476202 RepID=A0ABQ7J7J9_9APIC|nr:hypothetical protein IE077_003812 [Cardiosporidium cionae]|eukprot:KAF8819914.1 hypothetical protein IE077_003812 [Cardiosporidium cionae]